MLSAKVSPPPLAKAQTSALRAKTAILLTWTIQIDRKRLAKLRRMRMAAGHKADDHEQEQTINTMSMGW